MRHHKRRFMVLSFCLLFLVCLLSACQPPIDRAVWAREALQEKYGRAFEILQVYSQKIGAGYFEVLAADSDGIIFSAAIDTDDSNMSDSYVERVICDEIAAHIRGNTGVADIYVTALGPQPICDTPDISIEDYAALDPLNSFRVDMFLASKEEMGAVLNYAAGLSDIGLEPHIFVTDDRGLLAVRDYWRSHDTINLDYKKLTDPWECDSLESLYYGQLPDGQIVYGTDALSFDLLTQTGIFQTSDAVKEIKSITLSSQYNDPASDTPMMFDVLWDGDIHLDALLKAAEEKGLSVQYADDSAITILGDSGYVFRLSPEGREPQCVSIGSCRTSINSTTIRDEDGKVSEDVLGPLLGEPDYTALQLVNVDNFQPEDAEPVAWYWRMGDCYLEVNQFNVSIHWSLRELMDLCH